SVSLRDARLNDHWKKALKRQYPVRLESLTYSGLRCLQDDSIEFANGITVIVGSNGVGKSTLAHATADVLSAQGAAIHDHDDRLLGAKLNARITDAAGPRNCGLSIGP